MSPSAELFRPWTDRSARNTHSDRPSSPAGNGHARSSPAQSLRWQPSPAPAGQGGCRRDWPAASSWPVPAGLDGRCRVYSSRWIVKRWATLVRIGAILAEHVSGLQIDSVLADLTNISGALTGASAEAFASTGNTEHSEVKVAAEDLASVLLRLQKQQRGCLLGWSGATRQRSNCSSKSMSSESSR